MSLTLKEKISFGLGDVSHGLAVSSVTVWFLFYLTDVAGLSPFLAGLSVTIGRLWDAISDPVMGWLTDRTRSRWGKRLPYLLFGAIPYAISYFLLWVVPDFQSQFHLFLYVTITLLFFNTCLTMIFVPYTSLTAVLTDDYDERTALTGFRMFSSQIAFLVGAVIPVLIVNFVTSSELYESIRTAISGNWYGSVKEAYLIMALLFSITMVASIWTTFFGCSEKLQESKNLASLNETPLSYAKIILKQLVVNKPYFIAVMLLLLSNSAATLAASNLPYFITYVLNMEAQKQYVLLILFLSAICGVPFWVLLAKKIGKVEMYRIAMLFYIFFLCVLPFISGNSILFIYIISGVVGFCHAAAITLPWAIIPDIVEYDEYHNGSRREGLFYGGTTFSYKAATGIAFLLGSLILQLSGYVPNAVQSDSASFAIRFLVGPLPACFIAVAVIISLKYPLNKFRYEEILKELEKRRSINSY